MTSPRCIRLAGARVVTALVALGCVALGSTACRGGQAKAGSGPAEGAEAELPLRPVVMASHPNGKPSVVSFARGDTRVRDEHYAPTGVKIADVTYSDGGHRGAWKQYHPNGDVQAAYYGVDGKKQGQEWRYDTAGNRLAIVPYKDGVRDGTQFEFLPTGEKRSELQFKAGIPVGPMTTFYPTGEREAVVNIVNERRHGLQVEYHRNGNLRAELPFHFGVTDGEAVFYDERGVKSATLAYKQGVPHGMETRYYGSGNVKMTVPFVSGERHGMAVLYAPDGFKQAEIPFVHGQVQGFDRRFNLLGRMTGAVKYVDDAPNDTILTFYPSNFVEAERKYTDILKQNGTDTRYWDAGPNDPTPTAADPDHPVRGPKLLEVPIVNDQKHGQAVSWDREGHKIGSLTYVEDQRHGMEIRYHVTESGPPVRQAEYRWDHDRLMGMAQTWWKNGRRQSEFPTEDGHGSGIETRWDEAGKLRFRATLVQGQKQGKATLFEPKTGAIAATIAYVDDLQDGEDVRYDAKGKVRIIYIWRKGLLVGVKDARRKSLELVKYLTPEELEGIAKVNELDNPKDVIARAKAWQAEKAEKTEREALAAGAMAIRSGNIETYFKENPGQVQSRFPANGTGMEVQYHKSGEIRMIVPLLGGQRHGMARSFDETGTLWATVPFVRGSKHGIETRFARTGEKTAEYPYRSDQPTGVARTWYPDGSKQSEYNFEPIGRGTEVQYHRNGEVRLHIGLVDSKRQGLATIYTETGVKWAEVPYLAGLRHGTEVRFDAEGHRIREIVWRLGKQAGDNPVQAK